MWLLVLLPIVLRISGLHCKIFSEDLTRDYIAIDILSSKHEVKVSLDSKVVLNYNRQIARPGEFDNATDGLHLLAVNPRTGNMMMERMFATYFYAEDVPILNYIASFLKEDIIILAVKYDAGLNLSKRIRQLFHSLGSEVSFKTVFRSYFIWVFSRNGRTWVEAIIDDDPSSLGDFTTSPVRAHVFIPKVKEEPCSKSGHQRQQFCSQYSGYGALCDCNNPSPVNFTPRQIQNSFLDDVPVMIIANNRPQSLYRTLVTLLRQPGGSLNRTIVMVDQGNEELFDLLRLLQVPFVINDLSSRKFEGPSARISAHYKFSLNATFNMFPHAIGVIVLEEDIIVAPDFFSYFNQTAPLLFLDPSLYCINAWNDLTALHTFGNPHEVKRVEVHPGCGWMITRRLFEEVLPKWIRTDRNFDWDVWFRGPWVRGSRECIVPEISRTFHLSDSRGAHVTGTMTYSHFVGRLITIKESIPLNNVDRLLQKTYEEDLFDLLQSDRVVFHDTKLHPCHSNYMPRNYTEKIVVVFVMMVNQEDNRGWQRLAMCLGIWHLDARSHHRGLFSVYFYHTKIFVIGYPFSDYSFLKPDFIDVLSGFQTDWDMKHLGEIAINNRGRFRVPHLEKMGSVVVLDKPKAVPVYVTPSHSSTSNATT